MPRGNRNDLNGEVLHLTHRCHDRVFLLKFGRDRDLYRKWLYEACRRYGLVVLDYIITSNHVHLVVYDDSGREVVARSMHLIEGCVGQAYNRRKKRCGAFWQDSYHATAVQSGEHLKRCVVYVDLNMVRAGVVKHPSQWRWSGYNEIQKPRQRYRIVDVECLASLLGCDSVEELARYQNRWIDLALSESMVRQAHWSGSVAVGDREYADEVLERLGMSGRYRQVEELDNLWVVEEM